MTERKYKITSADGRTGSVDASYFEDHIADFADQMQGGTIKMVGQDGKHQNISFSDFLSAVSKGSHAWTDEDGDEVIPSPTPTKPEQQNVPPAQLNQSSTPNVQQPEQQPTMTYNTSGMVGPSYVPNTDMLGNRSASFGANVAGRNAIGDAISRNLGGAADKTQLYNLTASQVDATVQEREDLRKRAEAGDENAAKELQQQEESVNNLEQRESDVKQREFNNQNEEFYQQHIDKTLDIALKSGIAEMQKKLNGNAPGPAFVNPVDKIKAENALLQGDEKGPSPVIETTMSMLNENPYFIEYMNKLNGVTSNNEPYIWETEAWGDLTPEKRKEELQKKKIVDRQNGVLTKVNEYYDKNGQYPWQADDADFWSSLTSEEKQDYFALASNLQQKSENYNRLSQMLQQKIFDKYEEIQADRSSLDYILSSGFRNSIAGTIGQTILERAAGEKSLHDQLFQSSAEKRSAVERGMAGAAGLIADAPVFGLGGKAASGASNYVLKNIANRGLGKVSEKVAEANMKLFLQRSIPGKIVHRLGSGAVNFGTYGVMSESANQFYADKFDGFKIIENGLKEGVKGAVAGGTGMIAGKATEALSKLGSIGVYTGKIMGKAVEGLTFTGMGATEQMMEGAKPSDINWGEMTLENMAMVMTSSVSHHTAELYKDCKDNGLKNGVKTFASRLAYANNHNMNLTKEENKKLQDLGYGDMFNNRNIDNLLREKEVRISPEVIDAEYDNYLVSGEKQSRFLDLMKDKDIPQSVKQKLAFVFTGEMLPAKPVTRVDYLKDGESGTITLKTYSDDGTFLDEQTYSDKKKADTEHKRYKSAIAANNLIGALNAAGDPSQYMPLALEAIAESSGMSQSDIISIMHKPEAEMTQDEKDISNTVAKSAKTYASILGNKAIDLADQRIGRSLWFILKKPASLRTEEENQLLIDYTKELTDAIQENSMPKWMRQADEAATEVEQETGEDVKQALFSKPFERTPEQQNAVSSFEQKMAERGQQIDAGKPKQQTEVPSREKVTQAMAEGDADTVRKINMERSDIAKQIFETEGIQVSDEQSMQDLLNDATVPEETKNLVQRYFDLDEALGGIDDFVENDLAKKREAFVQGMQPNVHEDGNLVTAQIVSEGGELVGHKGESVSIIKGNYNGSADEPLTIRLGDGSEHITKRSELADIASDSMENTVELFINQQRQAVERDATTMLMGVDVTTGSKVSVDSEKPDLKADIIDFDGENATVQVPGEKQPRVIAVSDLYNIQQQIDNARLQAEAEMQRQRDQIKEQRQAEMEQNYSLQAGQTVSLEDGDGSRDNYTILSYDRSTGAVEVQSETKRLILDLDEYRDAYDKAKTPKEPEAKQETELPIIGEEKSEAPAAPEKLELVRDEEGNIDYDKSPVQAIVDELQDDPSAEKQIAKTIKNQQKQIEAIAKMLERAQADYDDADMYSRDQLKRLVAEGKDRMEQATMRLDHWKQVQEELNKRKGVTAEPTPAVETKPEPAPVVEKKPEAAEPIEEVVPVQPLSVAKKTSKTALQTTPIKKAAESMRKNGYSELADEMTDERPRTVEELAMMALIGDAIKLRWDNKSDVQKGLQSLFSGSKTERRKLQGLLSKDGMTIEEAADALATMAREEGLPFDENDAMYFYNVLTSVIKSKADLRSDLESSRMKIYDEMLTEIAKEQAEFAYEMGKESDADKYFKDRFGLTAMEAHDKYLEIYNDLKKKGQNPSMEAVYREMAKQAGKPVPEEFSEASEQARTKAGGAGAVENNFKMEQAQTDEVPFSLASKEEQITGAVGVDREIVKRLARASKMEVIVDENHPSFINTVNGTNDGLKHAFFDARTNRLYVNPKAKLKYRTAAILGHEMSHTFESLPGYEKMSKWLLDTFYKGYLDGAIKVLISDYKKAGIELTEESAKKELVADVFKNYVFADERGVKRFFKAMDAAEAKGFSGFVGRTIQAISDFFERIFGDNDLSGAKIKDIQKARNMFVKRLKQIRYQDNFEDKSEDFTPADKATPTGDITKMRYNGPQDDAKLKSASLQSMSESGMENGKKSSAVSYSVEASLRGAGFKTVFKNANGTSIPLVGKDKKIYVELDGKRFDHKNPIKPEHLKTAKNSAWRFMIDDAITLGALDQKRADVLYDRMAVLLNSFLKKGGEGDNTINDLTSSWQWLGETVFKSVATNGDKQYGYSVDITKVCKKNEAVINALSSLQRKQRYGATPSQLLEIYQETEKQGYQVPCPVCYVFSRYIRNGKYATAAINGMRKYGSHLPGQPDAWTVEQWQQELERLDGINKKNEKAIDKATKDVTLALQEIDDLWMKYTNRETTAEKKKQIMSKIKSLDARYKSALNVVSQQSLTNWIKSFAIHSVDKEMVLYNDTEFPSDMTDFENNALDLRLTANTMRNYPAIQRLRKSAGSAAGKEITYVSNNEVGGIPMAVNKADPEGAKNWYQIAAEAKTEEDRDTALAEARKQMQKALLYAQKQTLRGGQRMWSWSDNIERLSPDVALNLMTLDAMGAAVQSYSKQLEGVALVAKMGGYVNGSLMAKGNGYREVKPSDIVTINGKTYLNDYTLKEAQEKNDMRLATPVVKVKDKYLTLEFDDVVGIDPLSHNDSDGHKQGLFELNRKYSKAGNIMVGMNDEHIICTLGDDRVFFVIPWHSSGQSVHILRQMLDYLHVDLENFKPVDYTDMQEEKDWTKAGNTLIPERLINIWESHRNETDFKSGIGEIPSGDGYGHLSEQQLYYRSLRDAIFDNNLTPEQLEQVKADTFLSQAYERVQKVGDKKMTSNDKGYIYPYEYWDTTSTYDTADVNAERYIEYARRLGFTPKFSGNWKTRDAAKMNQGNFLDVHGYWKTLIDRRMYDVDGKFQDLDRVDSSGFSEDLIDPAETAKNYRITKVANDEANEKIADNVLSQEQARYNGQAVVDYNLDMNKAAKAYNNAAAKKFSVEANRSLVGIHNLTADKFRAALNRGGFANPSVAVIDKDRMSHTSYGEISLIMPKDKIDARTGKNLGTYDRDAWTPRYPEITYFSTKKSEKNIDNLVKDVEDSELATRIARQIKYFIDGNQYNSGLEYLFLKDRGLDPQMTMARRSVGFSVKELNDIAGRDLENISPSELDELPEETRIELKRWIMADGNQDQYDRIEALVNKDDEGTKKVFLKLKQQKRDNWNTPVSFSELDQAYYAAKRDDLRKDKIDYDQTINDLANRILLEGLTEQFKEYRDAIISGLGFDEQMQTGWKADGTRIYKKATLENISKEMNKYGKNASSDHGSVGSGLLLAKMAKNMKTLEEIRENSDRLQFMTFDSDASVHDRLSNARGIFGGWNADATDSFGYMEDVILGKLSPEQAEKEYNKNHPDNKITITDEQKKELLQLREDAKNLKVRYFETKFDRPVYLNEFAAAVVPENLPEDLKKAITDSGLQLETYTDETDRIQKTNALVDSRDDISFSVERSRIERSDNFKRWFGDWENDPEHASKVVDEDGRPLVVYHGTSEDNYGFTVFNTNAVDKNTDRHFGYGSNIGSHFGNEDQAKEVNLGQDKFYRVYLDIKNPYRTFDFFAGMNNDLLEGAHELAFAIGTKEAIDLFRSMGDKYPEFKDTIDKMIASPDDAYEIAEDVVEKNQTKEFDEIFYDTYRKLLKLGNYDGIIYENMWDGEGDSYVALEPTQIKSADLEGSIANNGEFNPENPDIRFSVESSPNMDFRTQVNIDPTDAQKEAGNYKKGHIRLDGYDITIENPKGSERKGVDADGKEWSVKMNHDYGYIKGTTGVDGDHIDVYLSEDYLNSKLGLDAGKEPVEGNVYVVDQIDQKTGEFDEHKVMYGYKSLEDAKEAYLSQYTDGWKVGTITGVTPEEFKKWVESSKRKTKPFAEYKSIEALEVNSGENSDIRFSVESDIRNNSKKIETNLRINKQRQLIENGENYDTFYSRIVFHKDDFANDFTKDNAIKALNSNKIKVYSKEDFPKNCAIYTSKEEADLLPGKTYEKEIPLKHTIWKDALHGIIAPVSVSPYEVRKKMGADFSISEELKSLVEEYDKINNSKVSAILDIITKIYTTNNKDDNDNNSKKYPDSDLIVAKTGNKLKELGIKSDYIKIRYKTIKDHIKKDVFHALTPEEFYNIAKNINNPILVEEHSDGPRLWTSATINGLPAIVGINKANSEVSYLNTIFGTDKIHFNKIIYPNDINEINPNDLSFLIGRSRSTYTDHSDLSAANIDNISYKKNNSENNLEDERKYSVEGASSKPRKRLSESQQEYESRLSEWAALRGKTLEEVLPKSLQGKLRKPNRHNGETDKEYQARVDNYFEERQQRHKAAASEVTRVIQEQINRDNVSSMDKSNLSSLMVAVKNATPENLDKVLNDALTTCYQIQSRTTMKDIDKLLALKKQDQNGKGISVAKNVDDSVRKVFELLQGKIADAKNTGLEEDVRNLRRDSMVTRVKIDDMQIELGTPGTTDERKQELEKLIAEARQHIEDNKTRRKDLEFQIDEIRQKNRNNSDLDADAQINILNEKMNDAAEGKAQWTQNDSNMLAAMTVLKAANESMNTGKQIWELQTKASAMEEQMRLAREQFKSDTTITPETKRAKLEALSLQIKGLKDMITEASRQKADQEKHVLEMLTELYDKGKASLVFQQTEEFNRKLHMIRGAFSDVRKPTTPDEQKTRENAEMGWLKSGSSEAVATFEYMAKNINRLGMGKDSWLYRHFMLGDEGVMAANDKYISGVRQDKQRIDEKISEIFGKGYDIEKVREATNKKENNTNIFIKDMGDPTSDTMYELPMSKGQAMYAYMVWKMRDGRAKMEQMGFTDESISDIIEFIGPKNRELCDWIQSEFLADLREKYNQTHLDMFQTSMAAIKDYIPLKIASVKQDPGLSDPKSRANSLQERAGSLINRTFNLKAVDLSWSGLDVVLNHIEQMEEWNAYARVRKDLDYILGSERFKNQLNENSKGAWKEFLEAAAIATRSNHEETNGMDRFFATMQKGLAGGAIAFRYTTALKQVLSVPAFFGYSQDPRFMAALTKNIGVEYLRNAPALLANMVSLGLKSNAMFKATDEKEGIRPLSDAIRFAMKNLPSYHDRVMRGTAGMNRLDEDANNIYNTVISKYNKAGMAANQMVDAITCAIGIKSIYDYKFARSTKDLRKKYGKDITADQLQKRLDGMDNTTQEYRDMSADLKKLKEAHRLALKEADVYYNGTQQSNNPAFLAPMQVSRGFLQRCLSLFKNSPLSYFRQSASSVKNLYKTATNYGEALESYKNLLMKEGQAEEDARANALGRLLSEKRKDLFNVALYGFAINAIWNMGGQGLLSLFRSDEDDKELTDPAAIAMLPLTGTPMGETLNAVRTGIQGGNYSSPIMLFEELESFARDYSKANETYGLVSPEVAMMTLDRLAKFGGVNMKTWKNIYLGAEGMIKDGVEGEDLDYLVDLMYLMNTPDSNRGKVARKLYAQRAAENPDMRGTYIDKVKRAMGYLDMDDPLEGPISKTLTEARNRQLIKEFIYDAMTESEREIVDYRKEQEGKIKKIDNIEDAKDMYNEESDPVVKTKLKQKMKEILKNQEPVTIEDNESAYDKAYEQLLRGNTTKQDTYSQILSADDVIEDMKLDEAVKSARESYTQWKEMEDDAEADRYYDTHPEVGRYMDIKSDVTSLNKMKKDVSNEYSLDEIRMLRQEILKAINE